MAHFVAKPIFRLFLLVTTLVLADISQLGEPVLASGPFTWPVYNNAVVTQYFGASHTGIDFAVANDPQFPVLAAADGQVTESNGYSCRDYADSSSNPPCYDYGNFLVITHPSGYKTLYGHLVRGSLLPYGTNVSRGQQIAVADDTGNSSANHLHFEVRNSNNVRLNPFDSNNCLWATCPNGTAPSAPSFQVMPPPWTADGSGNPKNTFRPGDAIQIKASLRNTNAGQVSFSTSWIPRDQNGNQVSAPSYSGTQSQGGSSTSTWSLSGTLPSTMPSGTYTYKVTANYNKETFGVVTFIVSGTSANTCSSIPTGQYCAEYYNNRSLSGSPTFARNEGSINTDWGNGGPGNGVGNDNFSVRWQGSFNFNSSNYKFTTTSDDGIRMWVDGNLVIDHWVDQGPTTYTATRSMSAGYHTVRVDYYENGGGAVARASWSPQVVSYCSVPSGQFCAEYYNNRSLSGSPTFTRNEGSINTDWGNGGPGNGVGNDNFSIRWQGSFNFNSATYSFSTTSDDGIRMWVDGSIVIDRWIDQGPTTYTATRSMSAGYHTVKVDYYENGGGAVARASWQQQNTGSSLVNGNFESGRNVGWSEYSSGGYTIVQNQFRHAGSWAAFFCQYDNCTEYITQQVRYSANQRLSFYWYLSSEEGTGTSFDYLRVQLLSTSGTILYTVATKSNTDYRNGWVQTLATLPSSYAGQTVVLRFIATTDSSLKSTFYVDDVAFQ